MPSTWKGTGKYEGHNGIHYWASDCPGCPKIWRAESVVRRFWRAFVFLSLGVAIGWLVGSVVFQ